MKTISVTTLQMCQNIRQARLRKGLSQEEVAELLDEKRTTYAGWEKDIEPKASTFLKIAEILEENVFALAGIDIEAVGKKEKKLRGGANSGVTMDDLKESLQQISQDLEARSGLLKILANKIHEVSPSASRTSAEEETASRIASRKQPKKGKRDTD